MVDAMIELVGVVVTGTSSPLSTATAMPMFMACFRTTLSSRTGVTVGCWRNVSVTADHGRDEAEADSLPRLRGALFSSASG
jgi:hypothetical protein